MTADDRPITIGARFVATEQGSATMTHEREAVRRMAGYTPGEQPETDTAIKLNTNENPYPPADAVMAALRDVPAEALRRYPSPTARRFRETAARVHGVRPEQIVTTNGGDELLRLAITTFVDAGDPIGVAEPSYSLYPVLAAVNDSPVVRVPLDADWQLPADFAAQLNARGVRLAFLVNPHAPSGTLLSVDAIAAVASAFNGVLLVDEAYVDFVDPAHGHDVLSLIEHHDNLLVLRTLSKGYSLAGLRFGYGIGPAALIEPIAAKTRDSYSVDAVGERLATAALEARDDAAATWRAVREERARMAGELARLGLTCAPSESNFLLATVPPGTGGGARALHAALRDRGLFVRHFDQERLADALRITIGTPAQNDRLLDTLGELIRTGGPSARG